MVSQLVPRVIKLFKNPREYWDEMATESGSIKELLVPQMLILAAIPSVAYLIGGLLGGLGYARFFYGRWAMMTVVSVLFMYPLSIGLWIAFGYIIDAFATTFGGQRDLGQSMKLATGAIIPVWLGQALYITTLPALGSLGALAGLGYACYLLYLGLPVMNGTPQEKAGGYIAAAVGCLVGASILVFLVTCVPRACCMAGAFVH